MSVATGKRGYRRHSLLLFRGKLFDWDKFNQSEGHYVKVKMCYFRQVNVTSAVDVHGNTINYRYKYEKDDVSGTLYTSPITGARTRAVYPWQIEWGAGGDKLLTEFNVTARAIGGLDNISTNDTNSGVYQKYRINKIDVKRQQQSTSTYALLRSYELQHSYGITLTLDPDDGYPYYEHLTLTGIKPIGNDGTTQLPSTTFAYYNRAHSQSFCPESGTWDTFTRPKTATVGRSISTTTGRAGTYTTHTGGCVPRGYSTVWTQPTRKIRLTT